MTMNKATTRTVTINWRSTKNPNSKIVGVINGDGLKLNMKTNHKDLEILGDGCSLIVNNNHGNIKIIGDGSKIEIIGKNYGEVEYHGDGGQIILNKDTGTLKKINYIGDGGQVYFRKTSNSQNCLEKKSKIIETTTGIGICRTTRIK